MKKLFKKNQIIITSLVIMIAIAGYMKYAEESLFFFKDKPNTEMSINDISEEDNQEANRSIDGDQAAGEAILTSATNTTNGAANTTSGAANTTGSATNAEEKQNTPAQSIAKARINREQSRSKAKEMLQKIIDDSKVTDAEKKAAIDSILDMAKRTEKETLTESLIDAKGYGECVIIINDNMVEAIMNMKNMADDERAQIENIIMRTTEMPIDKIVITPIK